MKKIGFERKKTKGTPEWKKTVEYTSLTPWEKAESCAQR